MSEPITILGGGSWGMAIAHLLDRKGLPVTLWEHFPEDYERLLKQRGNPDKLAKLKLADSIKVTMT